MPFGDYSTELADGAEAEAVQTGRALCQERGNKIPDAVLVSPYIRTNGTYQALVKGWPDLAKSPMVEEERIREQEHGKLLAYGSRKIYFALKPDQRILFDRQGEYWYRYPQGESVLDVRERNRSFIGMLIREHAGEDVLVVTHHLTILATRINLERRSWKDFARLDQTEKPINCGVTEYRGIPGAGRRGQGKIELVSSNRCLF